MRAMPELPEVEITARRLDGALRGATIESALAPGINALKTFDPPLSALEGRAIAGVGRRGKHLIVDVEGELALLIHLMSAGRLQLYDKLAGPRDRTSRLLVRLAIEGGRASCACASSAPSRPPGSSCCAPRARARRGAAQARARSLAGPAGAALGELLRAPRPLHALLRDQRTIAGIGRSWVDEILWQARLSPFKRGSDLDEDELERLREAIVRHAGRRDRALRAGRRSCRSPTSCPCRCRCTATRASPARAVETTLQAVHFEDYVIAYCPALPDRGARAQGPPPVAAVEVGHPGNGPRGNHKSEVR